MPPSLQHVPGSHLVRLPCRTVRELITCVLSPHCRATVSGSTGTVEHKLAGPIPLVRVTGGHEDDLPLGLGGGGTACPGRGRTAQAKRWEEGGERAQGAAQAHSPSRNTRATRDGGTGSLPVHPDPPVSPPPSRPSCVGGRGRRSSVTHAAPGRPAYPTHVPSSHLGLKRVGFTGGLLAGTQGCGGGAGPGGQRVWTGRAQCPPRGDSGSVSSLPQAHSGLLFPDGPSWWKSQQHLRCADPSVQGETTAQGRPACLGHTASESFWQHPWPPTRPSPAGDTQRGIWK